MRRMFAALHLLARFVLSVVLSGIQTMRTILFRADKLDPGLMEYPLPPMREPGVLILAAMITLTPGTTTVNIDLSNRRLRIHLLDRADREAVIKGIREEFEAPLLILFGDRP